LRQNENATLKKDGKEYGKDRSVDNDVEETQAWQKKRCDGSDTGDMTHVPLPSAVKKEKSEVKAE
jgi:hypothetical protein